MFECRCRYMKANIILETKENPTCTHSKHRCYLFIMIEENMCEKMYSTNCKLETEAQSK